MNSHEVNKVAGAVIGSMLVVAVIGQIGSILVHPVQLHEPVIQIATETAPQQQAAAPAQIPPVTPLLAAANAEAGATVARQQCASCHTFDRGGRNGVGPNLWNVVGRQIGTGQGFAYSDAVRQAGQRPGDDGRWTFEHINTYLTNPRGYISGTRMAFAGLRRPEDRANLIAWLRSQADQPVALPQ